MAPSATKRTVPNPNKTGSRGSGSMKANVFARDGHRVLLDRDPEDSAPGDPFRPSAVRRGGVRRRSRPTTQRRRRFGRSTSEFRKNEPPPIRPTHKANLRTKRGSTKDWFVVEG